MTKSAVVVPTNRPERIVQFVEAWAPQFDREDVRLIVVEDHPEKQFALPDWVEHYCHEHIDEYLGDKAGCIPRFAGGVRSFGFWMAAGDKTIDMIVSLDDDVLPLDQRDNFLLSHWGTLEMRHSPRWFNTMRGAGYPRGYPYTERDGQRGMLNHGLWLGTPDVDAFTQLQEPAIQYRPDIGATDLVPLGQYAPICIMNVAFRREVAPFMFMPLMSDGMKRWDDIWCGIIFKRIADLFGWAITSGYPCVRHERASDPLNNLKQEMLGYGINERLWEVVDKVPAAGTPLYTYRRIAEALGQEFPELKRASEAMIQWAGLWV